LKRSYQHPSRTKALNTERGQSIVLIAVAFVGLIAFVGLTVDAGLLFIGYGHLRRAVDAAAISAATQFRENYTHAQIQNSANEYLRLNDVNIDNAYIEVHTCATDPSDPTLCTTPKRKLVRIVARNKVDFAFLPVIGLHSANITAEAVGEAASMDVVLVLDISESMTWDAACGDGDDDDGDGVIDDGPTAADPFRPWRVCTNATVGTPDFEPRNPIVCNADNTGDAIPGECHPFEEVKVAAANFADWVLNKPVAEEEDRLAIVVFSNGWEGSVDPGTGAVYGSGNRGTYVVGGDWFVDGDDAVDAIENLQVYQADPCPADWAVNGVHGTCNLTEPADTFYGGAVCPFWNPGNVNLAGLGLTDGDVSTCATTAIGLGAKYGGRMFARNPNSNALWVMVLLTDGQANATELDVSDTPGTVDYSKLPWGYCPDPTNAFSPFCQDDDILVTHTSSTLTTYNADDYARDAARFVACDPDSPSGGCNGIHGQGAIIFSIGLGQEVLKPTSDLSGDGLWDQYGDDLMRFYARIGDDGNPNSPFEQCAYATTPHKALTGGLDDYQCGNYYFREFGGGLGSVFDDIAERIFTRITK